MKNLRGIIGAIIGAIVGAIPWLFVYVYGNYIISILAIFVALGANFLYRKFGGEVNKRLPMTISIISVLTIALLTFLVVPCLLLAKEGYSVNSYTLETIYSDSDFITALSRDLFVSIIFAIIGIIPIVNEVKRETGVEIKSESNLKKQEEDISKMKEIFKKLNAFDKENAVSLDELKDSFNEGDEKKFKRVKSMQIIKKYKGKYYFSEKAYSSTLYRTSVIMFKLFGIIIVFIILIILISMM